MKGRAVNKPGKAPMSIKGKHFEQEPDHLPVGKTITADKFLINKMIMDVDDKWCLVNHPQVGNNSNINLIKLLEEYAESRLINAEQEKKATSNQKWNGYIKDERAK